MDNKNFYFFNTFYNYVKSYYNKENNNFEEYKENIEFNENKEHKKDKLYNSNNVVYKETDIKSDTDETFIKKKTLNFMLASTITLCFIHPLDIIKTRKQIYRIYRNIYPYFYNNKYNFFYILKHEKIYSIYRGFLVSIITTAISHGIFRYIYDTLNYNVFNNDNQIINFFKIKKNINNSIYKNIDNNKNINNINIYINDNKLNENNNELNKNDNKLNDKIIIFNKELNIKQTDNFKNFEIKNLNYFIDKKIYNENNLIHNEKQINEYIKKKKLYNNNENIYLINSLDDTLKNNINTIENTKKNIKYYLITSTLSSLLSIICIHPLWFIKTKIEGTINLKYSFDNFKKKIIMKHYTIYNVKNRKYKYQILFFNYFIKCKKINKSNRITNHKKFYNINKKVFEAYKNNFIYQKNYIIKRKCNLLLHKNQKNINVYLRKKILHNYLIYEYYTLTPNERKMMNTKLLKHLSKMFYTNYLKHSLNTFTNYKIYRIFKREKNKKNINFVYNYENYFKFVYDVYKKEKLSAFYKGFTMSILLTPHVTINFFIYEYLTYYLNVDYIQNIIKGNFKISKNILEQFLPFLFGVISKCIAIVLTYPLYTIKVRQQIHSKNYNFIQILINIYKYEGILAYFTGMNVHIVRSCIQCGFLFLIFENLNKSKI